MIEPMSIEEAALDRYASRWTAKGYRLVKNPSGSELPAFLRSYRPDAILIGPEKIVVEVVQKGQTDAVEKVATVRSLLADHPDWHLEVLYAGVAPQPVSQMTPNRLRKTLDQIESANESDDLGTFLLLWAVLEAATRNLEPDATRRPQSPGRVVELLAASGRITPSDADVLRESAKLRNRLIHGDLDVSVPVHVRTRMSQVAEDLVSSLASHSMQAN